MCEECEIEALRAEVTLLKDQLRDYREALEKIASPCDCPHDGACDCCQLSGQLAEDVLAKHKARDGK